MKTYCFFTAHYLPHLGGVERYTFNLAKKLVSEGMRVIVVTSEMAGEEEMSVSEGIEIIRTDAVPFMNGRLPLMKFSDRNRKIILYLERQEISCVIINTKFYPITYIGAKFAKKNHIAAIVIEHGTGHLKFDNVFIDRLGEFYEHIMARLIFRQCKNFAGVSEECNIWLKHFGISAIGVLYNAIDYAYIQAIGNECEKSKCFDITYTGRILKEKGVEKLIKAFLMLSDKYCDMELNIVGDGPDMEEILRKYDKYEKIHFLGKLEFENVIRILKNSKIYCFPTDYPEGLPTCVLEAMACGVYTITSSSGGAKEVITDARYGIILKHNDTNEIANEIEQGFLNDNKRKKVAQDGKIRVRENFDWSCTCAELDKLIKKIERN